MAGFDRCGKVLQLLATQPWRTRSGSELAAALGIENVNGLVHLSHQGYINKIGPALYGRPPTLKPLSTGSWGQPG